jgi:hypothetical protein
MCVQEGGIVRCNDLKEAWFQIFLDENMLVLGTACMACYPAATAG